MWCVAPRYVTGLVAGLCVDWPCCASPHVTSLDWWLVCVLIGHVVRRPTLRHWTGGWFVCCRRELVAKGMTIVVDIRGATSSTVNILLESLYLFTVISPLHTCVALVSSAPSLHPGRSIAAIAAAPCVSLSVVCPSKAFCQPNLFGLGNRGRIQLTCV